MRKLFIFCLILLQSCSLLHASTLIEKTCQNVTQNQAEDYTFCVTSLQAAPGSHKADLPGLVKIATKLTLKNHTYVRTKAIELRMQPGLPKLIKLCLNSCIDGYGKSIRALIVAKQVLKRKDYARYRDYLTVATLAATTCDEQFAQLEQEPLLAKENHAAFELAGISLVMSTLIEK